MNGMKDLLDKFANFFFNLAVAGFAVALFQDKMTIMVPAFSCLLFGMAFAGIKGTLK